MAIVGHRQPAQTGGQERKRIGRAVIPVEGAIRGTGRRGMVGAGERGLRGGVGERGGRVGGVGRTVASIHLTTHRGVSSTRAAPQTGRRQGVAAGPAKLLVVEAAETARGGGEGAGRRSASHGVGPHAERRRRVHRRRERRIGDHRGPGSGAAAAQAVDVLGEVVIATAVPATLPVSCPEWDDAAVSTHASRVAHAVTVAHVGRHHRRRTVAIRAISHGVGVGRHSRERAAEASGATLEVGEATRGASPVARSGAVLRWGERGQDLGRTVQNTAGGRRDLNGLFVQSTAIHAETLGSLEITKKSGLSEDKKKKNKGY